VIQARGFSGKLNQDDSPFRLPAGDYSDALNVTRDSQGAGNDEIIANVPGNEVVNYAFSAGTNKVIGNYADKVRNRQYIFVWNSNGYHEITYYDATLNTIVKVIKNLTDTGSVNVLNFDPSWKINHIDIIYRDEEGDLLYWTDGLNPPRKINVQTAVLGNYGVIVSSYLDVAKEPPSAPPYCVYENDNTVTINNLNNNQFKFKYRFVFDDLEKSVTSAQSEIPIPFNYTTPAVYTDPTKNSTIFIVFQTGAFNVKKIELLAAQSQGVTFSDYFLIQVIDKAELGLNSNDVATFKFYNDQAYNIIPIKESIQPFDIVPLKAYTQSLPNGNVLDYGAITEGYNLIEPNYETTNLTSLSSELNNSYLLAVAYQDAEPAFGSGNIKIILGGNVSSNDQVNIFVTVSNVPYTITATSANPPDTIAGMITKLSTSAVAGGFTVLSSTSNTLVIKQNNSSIVKKSVVYSGLTPYTASQNSVFAYDWSSKYAYGVVYFDEKGRTNGVFTTISQTTIVESNALNLSTASFNYQNIVPPFDGTQKAVPYPIQTIIGNFTPSLGNTRFTNTGAAFSGILNMRIVGEYTYVGGTPFFMDVRINGVTVSSTSVWAGGSPNPTTPVQFDLNIIPLNVTFNTGDYLEIFVTHTSPGTWNFQLSTGVHRVTITEQDPQLVGGSMFQTDSYSEAFVTPYYIPKLPLERFTIESRPPEWAYYFQIVRTKNLSKSNFLYWCSDRTYKDNAANTLGYQYAYISITNLTDAIVDNPELKTLGYEFTVGDRIRFIKLIYPGTTTDEIYVSKDFQILESVTNPTINGVVVTGQLLKIYLPTTSSTFDFGGNEFANYFIQIYSPALSYSNEFNLYYEFGERYIVGNPGTALAYHQGMTQNQTANLVTPALYEFYKGDAYFRFRNIPLNGVLSWNMTAGLQSSIGCLGGTLVRDTNSNSDYSPIADVAPAAVLSSFLAIIDTSKTYSFLIKGNLKFIPNTTFSAGQIFLRFGTYPLPSSTLVTIDIGPTVAGVQKEISYSINLNTAIGVTYIGVDFTNPTTGTVDISIVNWTINVYQNDRIIRQGIIDPNFSDTYDSSATPNGRAWKVEPNAAQLFNPALIRFGDEFQPGTTINNTNRFYEENFDVYDRSRGSIKKMFIEGRNQYIFQQFDVGVVTVLTQIVRDTAGNPLSAQSDKLLNKIVYPYQGGYGIGEFPESFAYGKNAKYFIDGNKGVVVRLAQNGMTPISIVYKMNAFFVPRIAKYKDAFIPTTGKSTIYGAFDAYTNKYIIAMEEIYDSTPAVIQDAKTIAFLETATNKEGFESFLSFLPENMGALNNLFFSFKAGQIWKHLTPDPISGTPAFCNFYNTQYSAEVQVVFNETPLMKKYFLSIMESANTAWECPAIVSQLDSYSGTPQLTAISAARFKLLEGQYYSAIFRDINSKGGLINGAIMHGNYLIVRFKKDQASTFVYLNAVSLNYKESPLNLR
jgi:hypothetical protein